MPPASRTLQRGLHILEAVTRGGKEGMRIVELCEACRLERATVYRLLGALIETGYVMRLGRFRYVPGASLRALNGGEAMANSVTVRLQAVIARVSEGCGDAVFAVLRDENSSLCIARHIGTYPVQNLIVTVGTRQPLGVGAAGLALLSALPDHETAAVVDANTPVLAAYGGMTPDRLKILLKATRGRGWSVIGNHATSGALGVGVAVLNSQGEPVAAISVAAAIERMPRQRQQLVARLIGESLKALLPSGL